MSALVQPIGRGAIRRFYSKEDLGRFLSSLAEQYDEEVKEYAEKLGSAFRDERREKQGKGEAQRQASKGWMQMGSLMVTAVDAERAEAEVLLLALQDARGRLVKVQEALKALDGPELQALPDRATFTLYLKGGAPERLVINLLHPPPDPFSFSAYFRLTDL